VKVLPSNISERFTPRALAYWLAGEAWFHKGNGAVCITTHSYTKAEVEQLAAIRGRLLLKKFDLNSRPSKTFHAF
jgi:hypothetical protein